MRAATPSTPAKPSRRSFWIRQVTLWHWVSSGVCLGAMLLFTVTGITLNHAAEINATPSISRLQFDIPAGLREALAGETRQGKHALSPALSAWLGERVKAPMGDASAEWSAEEVYISLPQPGGDAWISIDRETGKAAYEKTDRGWIAYLNDLHKGRHTGLAWRAFIDVAAAACLVFTATGLVLLQTHASKRPSTWPLVSLGILSPILLLLLFSHS